MIYVFIKRLGQALVVLLGVALMIFLMLRVIPGNAIATKMGEHADRATVQRLTEELGLDQPMHVQFWRYLAGAVRGDFGTSYTLGRPVAELMGTAFRYTLILSAGAALFAWVTGLICGVLAAVRQNSLVDRLFMGFSLLGVSMPVFLAAMLLQYLVGYQLKWLPIAGVEGDWTGYILPAIALGWNSAGSVARLVRSTLTEVLAEDYIDTARAKGRGKLGILVFHALKNAMLPILTVMAMQFSGLLSGAVITETVFSINGLGRLAVQAISGRDIPLLQGTALFATAVVILGNLVADCLYATLDPRIRGEGQLS